MAFRNADADLGAHGDTDEAFAFVYPCAALPSAALPSAALPSAALHPRLLCAFPK